MVSNKYFNVQVDEKGHVVLPMDILSRYGIKPGMPIRVEDTKSGLRIYSPTRLAKLYLEPTNQCNLDCRTCIRKDWDEKPGMMSKEVFDHVIQGLKGFSPTPSIFFGGFGEPLFHPDIVQMISQAKLLGASVELITNGTLLTKELSLALVKAGLDRLWVSLDGATPESYADIRLGAVLPQVLENLSSFQEAVLSQSPYGCCGFAPKSSLGIVFVAMKRNIADLPAVIDIGKRFWADRFLVTNILPYTREMMDEALYYHGLNHNEPDCLRLPGIDLNEITYGPIFQAIQKAHGTWAGVNSEHIKDRCPFIESGAGAIGWDGSLSPCLPLMHSHTSHIGCLQCEDRFSRRWAIGNVMECSLSDLWNNPRHLAFRNRVQAFDFSPCTNCGSCEYSEKNEEDCFGNEFPVCGGCLWAQGVIQCP